MKIPEFNNQLNFNIINLHRREINCSKIKAANLLENFADRNSHLWPSKLWPRDDFDRPLQLGAIGGHGATKYIVEDYKKSEHLIFRFLFPLEYQGFHGFKLETIDQSRTLIIHFTYLKLSGYHWLMWHLAIRWVHDALIEDCFDSAELFLVGKIPHPNRWKWRVYFIRHLLGGGRMLLGMLGLKGKKSWQIQS